MEEIRPPDLSIPATTRPQLAPRLMGILSIFVILYMFFSDLLALGLHSQQKPINPAVPASSPLQDNKTNTKSRLDWHRPEKTLFNDLDAVLRGKGVYGFRYNSSGHDGLEYGSYNWCNMPHLRASEYRQPSKKYRLKYVEVIHRHHVRTPYAANSLPREDAPWNCSEASLYRYAQSSSRPAVHARWEPYLSDINPFKPLGLHGSCQFPQVTRQGLEDSWQHGIDLRGVYHDLLGFLPKDFDSSPNGSEAVKFRVSQNELTSQVAGMVVAGLFTAKNNVELLVSPRGYDSLEPSYRCESASRLYSAIWKSKPWKSHLQASKSLLKALDDITGVPHKNKEFHKDFDHYYDNLSSKQCHARALPCSYTSKKCISQGLADSVYRLGHWEYSYTYRDDPTSLSAAVCSFGVWIAELASHIRSAISGTSKVRYFHNIGHDGSIARLLSILQIEEMVWPGMGAEIVFEVFEKDSLKADGEGKGKEFFKEYFLRVFYGGKILKSSSPTLGVLDMVPLDRVLAYFDGLVGREASFMERLCDH